MQKRHPRRAPTDLDHNRKTVKSLHDTKTSPTRGSERLLDVYINVLFQISVDIRFSDIDNLYVQYLTPPVVARPHPEADLNVPSTFHFMIGLFKPDVGQDGFLTRMNRGLWSA